MENKRNKNCECCHGSFASGKEYGNFWCEIPLDNVEFKGLCEFCNPNNSVWYIPNKKCHFNLDLK